jgi:hypothetical protein
VKRFAGVVPTLGTEAMLSALYCARELLWLRHSIKAALLLRDAVIDGPPSASRLAARLISDYISAPHPVSVARKLDRAVAHALHADNFTFAELIPVLLVRFPDDAMTRTRAILREGSAKERRCVISALSRSNFEAVPLLRLAFDSENDLALRIAIASFGAHVLPHTEVRDVVEEGLRAASPGTRLAATALLRNFDRRSAERLARRRDPDRFVDAALDAYRAPGQARS